MNCLLFLLWLCNSQQDQPDSNLALSATVTGVKSYCVSDPVSFTAVLAVRLTFRNHGSRALIIQKNMLGDVPYCRAADTVQELESAFWQHLLILRADSGEVTDIDGYPDERFIVLKPGATYRGRSFVRVVHTKPFVGETYLQVRIPTWSGTDAQAEKAARKWEKTGVLWTRAVRSGPFAVTISKDQKLKKCS